MSRRHIRPILAPQAQTVEETALKRLVIMVLAVGVMAGSVVAAEAKQPRRVERTVVGSYGPYPAPVTGCNEPLGTFACQIVKASSTEAYFSAKVSDTHGQPVFVQVLIYSGGLFDHLTFCGETTQPIRIPLYSQLEFDIGGIGRGSLSAECPAHRVKTTGTISVTLSNLP